MNRRDFLKTGACASLAFGVPKTLWNRANGISTPALTKTHMVAIRGKDLYAMPSDVLGALGGIRKIVNQGESVFIKPNMA
jgi:hypothetical protein